MNSLNHIWLLLFFIGHPIVGNIQAQALKINEVQYVNHYTLLDFQGDTPDWIEIINTGNSMINLKGYQLSDDPNKDDGWSLPNFELLPDSVMIVFASGKNESIQEELHADFKLKLMEDPVFLLDPRGIAIDSIKATCVPPDKSLGRQPDGSPDLKILSPSPGFSNNGAPVEIINYRTDSLEISHNGGFYKDQLSISLSNKYPENQILFTLDGKAPNLESIPYSEPISLQDISGEKNRFASQADENFSPGNLISKANILRVQVFSEGCPASREISSTFFVNKRGLSGYQIPVVSLITDADNLFDDETGIYTIGNQYNYGQHGKEWERPVHVEIYNPEGRSILDQDAGMRIHGGGSRSKGQKSLRLYSREEYGTDSFDYPLFSQKPEILSYKTLVLRSPMEWSGTLIKDELCHTLVSDLHLDYCATQATILFLNGEYWGIYSLRERQDKFYAENNYGGEDLELDVISYVRDSVVLEEGSMDSYAALLDSFMINDPLETQFFSKLSTWIDLENMIDYYCSQFYLANTDFPQNNFKIWRVQNDTSKWRFFFFDLDGAMRHTHSMYLIDHFKANKGIHYHQEHTTFIFSKALQNPEFKRRFTSRLSELLQSSFNTAIVSAKIDEFHKLYQPLVSEHIYRWNHPQDYRSWISNVEMLRSFAYQRPQIMFDQLAESRDPPWSVYPNPSNNFLHIDMPLEFDQVTIRIYSLNGRCVFEKYYEGTNPVSLYHHLESGIYIIEMN